MAKSVDHVIAVGHNMKGFVIAPADGPACMGCAVWAQCVSEDIATQAGLGLMMAIMESDGPVPAQKRRGEVARLIRDQADAPPVRDRSVESGATHKAANISMLEIKSALSIVREDNAGGDDADLIRSAPRLLGFRRVGTDLQSRFSEAH